MRRRAEAFGSLAQTYADYRPGYPDEAIRWLVGNRRTTVLELGAGTGKLTHALVQQQHQVVASEPATSMLQQLRTAAPEARAVAARAEDIPLPSSSVDVVIAGQAFHWFDQDHALPEIARVLRPGGVLAMAWNYGDTLVPWVRRIFNMRGMPGDARLDQDPVADSSLFEASDHRVFRHWQTFFRDSLIGFVGSNSGVAILPSEQRQEVLDEVATLYDGYGRGYDGMLMPWKTYCFRTHVTGLANYRRETSDDLDSLLIEL